MLGELPGVEYVGELPLIWREGVMENTRCGCSAPFLTCPFWSKVGEVGFGGWDSLNVPSIMRLKASVDRHRFLPLLVRPGLSRPYQRRLERYAGLLERLYAAMQEVSGARVIVESSSRPSTAFLLRRIPRIDLRLVHLVRDSRAVAYAWTKRVPRPEATGKGEEMPRFGVGTSAAKWTAFHWAMERLPRLGVPSILVRYETFVADPQAAVREMAAHAGLHPSEGAFRGLGPGDVELGMSHTIAGNPMRFRTGPLVVRRDDEWKRKLGPGQRVLVSSLSWPMLLRYDYPLRSKR
jgi:hypothetical protein